MELLNIKDYEENINKEKYDIIRKDILEKAETFADIIIKEKNVDLDKYSYYENKYEKIYQIFYKEINLCDSMKHLIKWLALDNEKVEKYDVETWIRVYNELTEEYNEYLEYKENIDKIGYENIIKDYKDKIKALCKEMLDYKNKKYEDAWSLGKFLEKAENYYNYHIFYFDELSKALMGFTYGANIDEDFKPLNYVERIIKIEGNYIYLKNHYKENAFIYRDFDLEEGETFSDLHRKMLEERFELYKEMLNFLNVPYNENDAPIFWEDAVIKNYPYYEDIIKDKNKPVSFNPYAASLTRMQEATETLREGYKNHDEDLKKYLQSKKDEKNEV